MSDPRHSLVAELERRIHELEQHAEDSFGEFGALDWWLCLLVGLAAPVALIAVTWP